MEILSSAEAAKFIREKTRLAEVEELWALALNTTCTLLAARMLFRGTVDACFIHPRDIFRFAISQNATSVLVGHNHPSGSILPSRSDVVMSGKLKRAGELLQIPVVDHVIVTAQSHFSFAERFWSRDGGRAAPVRGL